MGGTIEYVYRNGQRLTLWMLYVILLLDRDLFRAFGVHVIVTSAIRTRAEQERIFRERYVTAGNVNGRRVYDTRVWRGVRWYRISAAGTVAVPGFSNHEIQGDKAAVDIRDTGADAGITVASSARGVWIRQWCRRTGLLIASGDGFREGWHFDVPGIFRMPPELPEPPAEETTFTLEDEMGYIRIGDNGPTYVYSVNDAQAVSQEEASALARAATGNGTSVYEDGTRVFRRISSKHALAIIDGVKYRRTRMYAAIAEAAGAAVAPDFSAINADLDAIMTDLSALAAAEPDEVLSEV